MTGQGRKIWGVLYEIPDELIDRNTSGNRKSLDAIEGRKYERRTIRVVRADGTPVEKVITYVVKPDERANDIQTSVEYCSHILNGLRQHDVPNDYIEYVKRQMIANNQNLQVCIENF